MYSRDEIRRVVFESVSQTFDFPIADIREDMNAGDVSGWDSISTSYLIMEIEERFDREFSIATWRHHRSISHADAGRLDISI